MLPFYHFLLFFHNRWTVFCAIFSYFLLSYFGRVLDMTQSHWEQKLIRKGDNMCGPQTIYMEVGIGFESIYLKDNLQPASLKNCKSEQHTEVGLSHKRLWPYQWMALELLEGTHSIYCSNSNHSYFRWYYIGTFVPQKILAISVNGTCATCGRTTGTSSCPHVWSFYLDWPQWQTGNSL